MGCHFLKGNQDNPGRDKDFVRLPVALVVGKPGLVGIARHLVMR